MSLILWNKLPSGFLKKGYPGWARLDHDVKLLIVELAEKQSFRCANCGRERGLVIEHDHYPEHGTGDRYTTYNIRGLVCQGCNWHLMIYEKDLNGEYRGFDEAYSNISDREYETYIYAYDCRVLSLNEASLEKKMGSAKYYRRRIFLNKFDDWKNGGLADTLGVGSLKKSKTRDMGRLEQLGNSSKLYRLACSL